MAKMTVLPESPTWQSTKAMRGPIKVGNTGEFSKYGENDNIATIPNKAKHKGMRGLIKVGDTGEFGKYGENDSFARGKAIRGPIKRQHGKAQSNEGAHKSWQYWRIYQIWRK